MQACLDGDTRAFEVLVDRYYKVLFNVALRMLNDAEDARDVTQVAFLRAYEKLRTFDPRYKFFSWIYRILVNEALNVLAGRRPRESLDPNFVAPQRGPDEEYEQRRTRDAIGAALQRLSLEHREVVILRYFLGFSYEQMTDVLELPMKTIKSRLYEARRHLCALLLDRSAKP